MDCEYHIITKPNQIVLLKFETVNLKRRYPDIGIIKDIVNNEHSDDTLTIFDVDPLNKTSNVNILNSGWCYKCIDFTMICVVLDACLMLE